MMNTKPVFRAVVPREGLIFEKSQADKPGTRLPKLTVNAADPAATLGAEHLRQTAPTIPQLSEPEVVRHFTRLSMMNYQIETGIYPLGSCTMKYNPKLNEDLARDPHMALAHPMAPEELTQGHLAIIHELERDLAEITGLPGVSTQPAAGAHGEYTALMVAAAYFKSRGEKRDIVVTPDTSHGTNPASAAIAGFECVEIPTDESGVLHADAVKKVVEQYGPRIGVLMVTNPNTLGRFESNMGEISEIIHKAGGLVYSDGANLNAILGVVKPADYGTDLMHINLHKTFSTPHGGGGPGSGPICVRADLEPFLPSPRVVKDGDNFRWNHDRPKSIGKVKSFFGNYGVLVRAWAYIRVHGAEGLRDIAENAVLNANYIKAKLQDLYPEGFPGPTLHESVLCDRKIKEFGVTTTDVAKMLLDEGMHPPTVHFPLVVKGALMIEPTETESLEELDRFIDAMRRIYARAESGEAKGKTFPLQTPVGRLDETLAARQPKLRWQPNA
jgi:glycine dehydrogenase subunit 2